MGDGRWLVVGLGNPEPAYARTRHNVGAEAVRALAGSQGAGLKRKRRLRGEVAEITNGGDRFVLFVPDAYMNVSGDPVRTVADWYKIPVERIVVCHDDLDLEPGSLRLKRGGGHGGHNGLRDLDRALGGAQYVRVRIGIGRPPGRIPGRDHVLGRFGPEERPVIDRVVEDAGDAAVSVVTEGLEPTQNRYHGRG